MDRREELITREANKPGMRGKVNAKCIECIYDDIGGNGTWRAQVEDCKSLKCPLYEIRPKPSAEKKD